MKEERRFIRAIIPGFLFIVELSIVLWAVLCRSQIENIIDYFRNGNITAIILVFIGVGGIGYFLAIIYRFFHWVFFQLGLSIILEGFLSQKILDLRVRNNEWNSKYIYFRRCGAWRILNLDFCLDHFRITDLKKKRGLLC